VRAGDTETFTTTVTLNPDKSGYYAVGLTKVRYNSMPAFPNKTLSVSINSDPLYIPNGSTTAAVILNNYMASAITAVGSTLATFGANLSLLFGI
jgi:hypothetical protein